MTEDKLIWTFEEKVAAMDRLWPTPPDFNGFVRWTGRSSCEPEDTMSDAGAGLSAAMALHDSIDNCPFCGSEGVILEDSGYNGKGFVRCWTCFSAGPESDSRSQAVEAWNRRASPPSPNSAVTEAAKDLLNSLDPDPLNPEQFNAWIALADAIAAAPTGGQP